MITLEIWWLWFLLGLGFVVGFIVCVTVTWTSVLKLGRREGYIQALNDAHEIEAARARARLQVWEDRDA